MTSIMIPLLITFEPHETKTALRLTKLYDMNKAQLRDNGGYRLCLVHENDLLQLTEPILFDVLEITMKDTSFKLAIVMEINLTDDERNMFEAKDKEDDPSPPAHP
eukprot:4659569-Ditylum_brightwellii.AAC.1